MKKTIKSGRIKYQVPISLTCTNCGESINLIKGPSKSCTEGENHHYVPDTDLVEFMQRCMDSDPHLNKEQRAFIHEVFNFYMKGFLIYSEMVDTEIPVIMDKWKLT